MQLNESVTINIDKLMFQKNVLTLGVLVKDAAVSRKRMESKLAVVFENESETRYMPMPITASNYDEKGMYTGYAFFDFELDTIFENNDLNDFLVHVEIYNGQEYKEVLSDTDTFMQLKKADEYRCFLDEGRIHICRKRLIKPYPHNILVTLFGTLFRLVEIIIGTLLLPLFVLDGLYVVYLGNRRWLEEQGFGGSRLKRFLLFAKWRYSSFCRLSVNFALINSTVLNVLSTVFSVFMPKKHILFVSSRRKDITGNIAYVNDVLGKKNVQALFWLEPGRIKDITLSGIISLAWKIAQSKVIIVDDFTPVLNDIHALKSRKLIQLWHACGAFKTFGFSRLGKDGGPAQTSRNHRNYDYVMVSSSEIRRFYAEGFGVDVKNVLSLGVPRTDDFFREDYKVMVREKLYTEYPGLKGKKIILFAPTFRGNGADTAFYPFDRFSVDQLVQQLGEDYVVIIKHHPFVCDKHPVNAEIADRVLDLSRESEINDLLFITDLLITDYSSVIFEASLLDIPMLFYAFDLEEYVVTRDFYYPFKDFVPGRIVRSMQEILDAVSEEAYEQDKVKSFKHRFFDDLDGKASERVADFVLDLLECRE